MLIRSVFNSHEKIPVRYTIDGENISPSIDIMGAPINVKSYVLIFDDPDAPRGDFVHWIIFNIPGNITRIEEDSIPANSILGKNDAGKLNYIGPAPPYGVHRYFFKIYVLDIFLDLKEGAIKKEILESIEGHILEKAELIGVYGRN